MDIKSFNFDFRHAKAIYQRDQIRNSLQEVDNKFDRLQLVLREEGDKKRKIEQKLAHYGNLEGEVKKLVERVDIMNRSYMRKLMEFHLILRITKIPFLALETIQSTFQTSLLSDLRKMFNIECNLVKVLEAIDELQILRKTNQAMENVHKQEHETQLNTLKESEEQYKKASVSFQNQFALMV